jgi:hypothetical protein
MHLRQSNAGIARMLLRLGDLPKVHHCNTTLTPLQDHCNTTLTPL